MRSSSSSRSFVGLALVLPLLGAGLAAPARVVAAPVSAAARPAGPAVLVGTEAELRRAWADGDVRSIRLTRDVALRACRTGDPLRESTTPVMLDGGGHVLRQRCFEKRVLRQDGTGLVTLRRLTVTRGGTDGPGGGVFSRGEVRLYDSTVAQNRSEEPGGGVFSMRRVLVVRSSVTGNLANDDGGGVYARRGGVSIQDSTVSSNLVDGSGGAVGSTGDIVIERSHLDGNTTDGDGGAIYADEQGDVTVVDSTVDGSTADGPGGAIFTVDGDVLVVRSTLNGNRADDRGGAISGESDVTIVDSTVARNAAVAHVGGGIFARGELVVVNTTVTNNYAEGEGGGILGARSVRLDHATILDNVAPMAADVGAGDQLIAFGSVVGPANLTPTGEAQATATACRAPRATSLGYNAVVDTSCGLRSRTDLVGLAPPLLSGLAVNGGLRETRMPVAAGPLIDRIPVAECARTRVVLPASPFYGARPGGASRAAAFGAADGRGVHRPQGPRCDIGAVEYP